MKGSGNMQLQEHKLNRDLIAGWFVVVIILFVSYVGEVIKGERTLAYLAAFMLVTAVPPIICFLLYRKEPAMAKLRYYIVIGYFMMYLFSICTGSTSMTFCYILPMLSLLVLYHQPSLILYTGIASLLVNIVKILIYVYNGDLTLSGSKDEEIQIALLFLCFAGSYVATRLYDSITKENTQYVEMLDEKNNQIQSMTLQAIMTIANTIDAKDKYTQGHSKRVAEYSVAIARELGVSAEEVENIRFVALLHDIGKIGVPDSILNKPGKLTDTEYELMKQHTVTGEEILKDIGMMISGIDVGAMYHHERFDGSGYPDGLKGEEIPYIARIISVADAYDAMTSNRVYRRHLTSQKVVQELEKGKGKQFDPTIADVMVRLIEENRLPDPKKITQSDYPSIESTTEKILNRVLDKNNDLPEKSIIYDELTGAYNCGTGERMVRKKMRETKGCFVIVDVDRFREINNTLGFVAGDTLLRSIVDIIKNLGGDQILYRFGGDEFVVYFSAIKTEEDAHAIMDRFMDGVGEIRLHETAFATISASAGVAMNTDLNLGYNAAFQKADKALYYAKQQGGGQYYFHHEANMPQERRNLSKVDLENLIQSIKDKDRYKGAFRIAYSDFGRIYELVRKIVERYDKQVQIVLFTLVTEEGNKVSLEERDRVMAILEQAILVGARDEDVTTKYSSTQRIVILAGMEEEQVQAVTDQIMLEFYKMYDKKEISICYDIADLGSEENGGKNDTN